MRGAARNLRAAPENPSCEGLLLDFDGGAGLFELRLDRVGLLLRRALLDRLRGRVHEVLCFLQAEAGDRADDLDHLDLLATGVREDDVERRLLLSGRRAVAGCGRTRGCYRDRSCGGDAPLVLDLLLQLDEVEHGHLPELVEHLVDCACSHLLLLLCGLWFFGCRFCLCRGSNCLSGRSRLLFTLWL